jgi:predicted  nucleic acid-binding Zn-ribbon protein
MGIQESIDVLKRAQEMDRDLYRIQRELARIPEALREMTLDFEAEKIRTAELENSLKQVQLRQKQKEGELSEKEALIRKYDTQLTQVKTNKEYTTLQGEIANLKADNSMLEDQILSIMEEIDQAQRALREERERLTRAEKELQEQQKELQQKGEVLKQEAQGLNAKRAEIMAQVPPETRELYDRIVEKKEGLALVPVEGETCSACRIEIRPQLLNEIKLKEALVVCENCSRILYFE